MENEASDGEIIARVLAGDVNAFEALVGRYQRYVTVIVSKHVSGKEVEEIAHDVFVQAFQGLGSYRGSAPFRYWLARIAVRRCYRCWRERGQRQERSYSELSQAAQQWCEAAAGLQSLQQFNEGEERAHAQEVLAWALARLSPEDRMVLSLVHLEERPVKEAARLLGWSVANVKVRAFRARRIVQKLLVEALAKESE